MCRVRSSYRNLPQKANEAALALDILKIGTDHRVQLPMRVKLPFRGCPQLVHERARDPVGNFAAEVGFVSGRSWRCNTSMSGQSPVE